MATDLRFYPVHDNPRRKFFKKFSRGRSWIAMQAYFSGTSGAAMDIFIIFRSPLAPTGFLLGIFFFF